MDALTLQAYAKINLGLLLLGRRDDGYTDIATVFQEIDLADTLHFSVTPGPITLRCTDPDIPVDHRNLVWKAMDVFRQETGVSGGLDVSIEKRIPSGGGLGGGSADAAATLRAANVLFDTRLDVTALRGLALNVGSDVPFLIDGGSALGLGRGERLEPLDTGLAHWIVLLLPGISVSTAWAYGEAKIALTKNEKLTTFRALFRDRGPEKWQNVLINELEPVVFARHGMLARLKEALIQQGAVYAAMSGSGSTVYGLFTDEGRALRVAQAVSRREGIQATVCRPRQV